MIQPGLAAFSHMLSSSWERIITAPPRAMSVCTLVPKLNSRMRPLATWPMAVGSLSTPSTRSSPPGPSHDVSTWPTWPPAVSCSTSTGRPGSPCRPAREVPISAAFRSAMLLRLPSRRGGGCAICARKATAVDSVSLCEKGGEALKRLTSDTHSLERFPSHHHSARATSSSVYTNPFIKVG